MKHLKKLRREDGVTLIMVIIAGMFLSVLGYVTVSTVVMDSRTGTKQLQATQAFWLAEGGVELGYRWLEYQDPPPSGINAFIQYNDVQAGAGTYTVTIDPDNGNTGTYLKKYTITAVGKVADVERKLQIEMQVTTFNRYAYLTGNEGGTIWFNTGDLVEGPMHSNDQISIVGSPVFMGKVTSTASSFHQGFPFTPDFQDGYQLGVPPVVFPTMQDIMNNYWAINTIPPSLIIDARFGRSSSIELKADGTLKYNVWHWVSGSKVYDIQNAVVNVADLNGFVKVKGSTHIKGTLDGVLTVITTGNIYIQDDIVYKGSDANGKPLPGSDDMLGLIAKRDIIVEDNAANGNNVIIDGALLSLGDSFTVENYSSGSPRGDLSIYGSLSQKVRGPVGTFSWWGGTTGYAKDYHYDTRFLDVPPPYYPTTGQYHYTYWKEITE